MKTGLRLVFEKTGRSAYGSHLDLMRTFQRSFLRANLLLRHTEGFHPHPILSIVLPLPLGCESRCEMLDFSLDDSCQIDPAQIPERLNPFFPEGIRSRFCGEPIHPVRDLGWAKYTILLEYDQNQPENIEERIGEILSGGALIALKKTKKDRRRPNGEFREIDILPHVKNVAVHKREEKIELSVCLAAGENVVSPAMFLSAVTRTAPELTPDFAQYMREEIFTKNGERFC